MCEQTEINYLDGEVVWVKLGSCWWPGEVVALEKLPPDVLRSFRKPPIACVKFFQEDAYEYVKNINNIYKYNCSRKNEFINKGLYMFRTKHGHMEKFPDDVIRAETAVGGDIEILTREEFQETKKESYAGLFGDPKKTPSSVKKGKSGRGRPLAESPHISTPRRQMKEKTDYKVHILVQGSKPISNTEAPAAKVSPTPSTSGVDSTPVKDKDKTEEDENTTNNEDKQQNEENTQTIETPKLSTPIPATPLPSTPPSTVASSSGIYACHACPFTTSRLNVLILHNKTHSVSFVPYTPSPIRKKPVAKTSPKHTPNLNKTPKPRKPRKEKTEKKPPKKLQAKKRASEEKQLNIEIKKPKKTDEEIKSSLLADWDDDDVDDDSNDEASAMVSVQSPEVPVGAESPAVPTPAELPSALVPGEMSPVADKKSNSSPSTEKPESSSDSKYEFCEDEDWPEEADIGRKIPRVKNPVRTEDPKNAIDEDEVAREVAELLNKTAVPELPSVPEPLKIEENFPEPSIVKSPDKSQGPGKSVDKGAAEAPPTKAIFKTKTFFRSRHSRSQDAIVKYVAEQLNAAERMDITESEMNGSEGVSSPEARDSPPIEPVKVARLAPKIQLKKMKAEAAQLREKEKMNIENASEPMTSIQLSVSEAIKPPLPSPEVSLLSSVDETDKRNDTELSSHTAMQDVLYPTQEIKPLNTEMYLTSNIEVLRDQFENQDAFMEEDTSEFDKETSNPEHKSKYDIDTTRYDEESSKRGEMPEFDDNPSKLEIETSNYAKETTNFEKGNSKFDKEISDFDDSSKLKDKTSEIEYKNPEFDRKTSEFTEVVQTSEFDKVTLNTCDEEIVLTSKFEKESYELGNERSDFNLKSNDEISKTKDEDLKRTFEEVIENINEIHHELNNKKSQVDENQVLNSAIQETHSSDTEELTNNKSDHKLIEPFMNESTASAVDALLSVSRETDRVPRVVSNDLPEDLFEDDKDTDNIDKTPIIDDFDKKMETNTSFQAENGTVHMEQEEIHHDEGQAESPTQEANVLTETVPPELHNEEIVDTSIVTGQNLEQDKIIESIAENVPSESDLQVAEALINLPATAIQTKTPNELKESLIIPFSFDHEISQEETVPVSENEVVNETEVEVQGKDVLEEIVENVTESMPISDSENINARFETEQEKSENLNAAQSLVQMSESIEHKINMDSVDGKEVKQPSILKKRNNGMDTNMNSVEQNLARLSGDNNGDKIKPKTSLLNQPINQSSSKLLKILEEPCKPKIALKKPIPNKPIIQGKEKILNFDVAKSTFKSKAPKQNIIIRRTPTPGKAVVNNVKQLSGADKIVLSRSGGQSQEGSSLQTYTIQTSPEVSSDANTIIIQQKIRKTNPTIIQPKLHKIKPQTSLVAPVDELKAVNKTQTAEEALFDINSMPIVLSEDLLTPESIEKMPVVMSDAKIISQPQPVTKVIKPKQIAIEHDKIAVSSAPHKPEVKTLLLNPGGDVTKSLTPNILSKSSKLRGAKPMLIIDKATGKQKIIMTKAETVKEVKQAPAIIQPASQTPKTEKFIILPTQTASPRPTRTQKIVIDPQTGKAHVFVAKGSDVPLSSTENKPVSAKLVSSNTDASAPGNTVMIITNAQGAQSRIVLTPEHEKILFPNKQPNVTQLKTIAHRITTSSSAQKTVGTTISPARTPAISSVKAPTRIVPKQKSAIITSKGQLIVGGRVATTAQNIAPMPELRPVQKRVVTSEPPKKLTQAVQKTNSEPIIFLQQKSGAVMQLTAAQFEHLQRTGQIVQKSPAPAPVQEKMVIQKLKPAAEPGPSIKPRIRKAAPASPTPVKKVKHEIAIAPAPAPTAIAPAPAPAPAPPAPAPPSLVPAVPAASNVVSIPSSSTSSGYSEFDNFEELLPSTTIARQPEPVAEPPPPAPAEPAPAPPGAISDQLLAVPGEHFGGLAGTFYLCVEDNGTYTPIDNRPLVLENNQLVPMEPPQPERRDILEAALANSDVFHAEPARDEAPDFRDLNANVSVHCRVSETSTTLNQPIMTPVERPRTAAPEPAVPASLEAGLAVIGVTPLAVPTSLELPITVTDPRIAPRAADPLAAALYDAASMPLLADEDAVGKSMPILTDEAAGGAEAEGGGWSRRLLAPADGDLALQLSVGALDPRR